MHVGRDCAQKCVCYHLQNSRYLEHLRNFCTLCIIKFTFEISKISGTIASVVYCVIGEVESFQCTFMYVFKITFTASKIMVYHSWVGPYFVQAKIELLTLGSGDL